MKVYTNYLNVVLSFLVLTLIIMIGYGVKNLYDLKIKDTSEVQNPSSYKDLYYVLKNMNNNNDYRVFDNKDVTVESSKADFSDTNLQVLGVQEADVVKTDGNYIYAYASNKVYIIEVNNGQMRIVSEIKDDYFQRGDIQMYVYENRLVVIINSYMYGFREDYAYPYGSDKSNVYIYDITNRENPIKLNHLSQDGNYLSSRMIDNYLYIITNYYVYNNDYKLEDYNKYVPNVYDGEYQSIKANDIYIVPNPSNSSYVVTSSIDVNNPSSFKENKAVLGAGGNIYADQSNLIIASYDSKEEGNIIRSITNLMRFEIKNGNINFKSSGMVYGNILNQFSMDIYNDHFRIVTTSYDYKQNVFGQKSMISIQDGTHNNLYVLDMDLKQVGKIENIAKDERVYSVLFDQEYAYFVTFKQVDPLFSVDLSNPSNPKILGALKIPGFSEYLHLYSEDLLFGIGREVTNDRVIGIKISMFDISDKTNVLEKFKLNLGDDYNWSEALYNHKAILISKDLIGFPSNNGYLLYTFNNNDGFSKLKEFTTSEYYDNFNTRGLYVGEYFYIFSNTSLKSYDMVDYDEFNNVIFDKS